MRKEYRERLNKIKKERGKQEKTGENQKKIRRIGGNQKENTKESREKDVNRKNEK